MCFSIVGNERVEIKSQLVWLSNCLLPLWMLPSPSEGKCCWRRWSGKKWTFITSCCERMSASETQVLQTLRQLHQGNKGQREGEAGMSPLDQLIGQPETEEQLRKLVVLFSEVESSVQKWRLKFIKHSFYPTNQGSLLFFCAAADFFLSKSTELWDSSILSSQPTRPSPLDIFNNNAASQKKVLPKILIFKPYFRTSTSQLLFWFGHEFLGSALHPWSRGPGAAPTMSELIPFTRYQPRASHSFSEQNQAFALALALCAINNSQQTGSVPGKTVEWTISSKHRMCLLGVSECWCIPAEPVSCPMNQTPLLNHRYPTSDATFSCFLLYNIATKVFR